jgi:AcrR family transcriptional regulator
VTQTASGRRERKKAATRRALADAALELFLERGYDQVSVRDVAEAADVSTTTVFKHFPRKEALVFDREDDHEASLAAAVRDRAPGQSVPAALHAWMLAAITLEQAADPRLDGLRRLTAGTPALREYADRRWLRHETALARAIAAGIDAPADDLRCAALARFALESRALVRGRPDPAGALGEVFVMIEHGWSAAV